MNKKIKIIDLCSQLDEQFYENMDIQNMTDLKPSEDRIKNLVFQRLENQKRPTASHKPAYSPISNSASVKKFPKKAGRLLLIAAILCLFATTVFASVGGFDYFRSIFGDSAGHVKDDIQFPMNQASNDEYQITLESMLTDGYRINLIVSLESLKGSGLDQKVLGDELDLFRSSLKPSSSSSSGSEEKQETAMSYTCSQLSEFSTDSKRFYHIQIDSIINCLDYNLDLSLNPETAPLSIHSIIQGAAAAKEISVNRTIDLNNPYTLETIQLSPLGVMVIGREEAPAGGLPTPQIDIKFKDGSVEELMSSLSFDSGGDETVTAGGGSVISNDPTAGPLVISTYGQRNPDGKVVTTGDFGRIINLDDVDSLIVEGDEYSF